MDQISSRITETITVKKDVTVMMLSIKRSKRGILVTVKADSVIEELFRSWAGESKDVLANLHGRAWEAAHTPLGMLYALQILPDGAMRTSTGKVYNVSKVGCKLTDDEGINLGFLRFRGISDSDGVNFIIKGVYSSEEIRRIAEDIKLAVQHFYVNYIKPIDVVIQMHTQEI